MVYQKIKTVYNRLIKCHEKYKLSVTKLDYSNVCVECLEIEKELDELELFKIKDSNRDKLHKMRKLMLLRTWELEAKAKKKYLNK